MNIRSKYWIVPLGLASLPFAYWLLSLGSGGVGRFIASDPPDSDGVSMGSCVQGRAAFHVSGLKEFFVGAFNRGAQWWTAKTDPAKIRALATQIEAALRDGGEIDFSRMDDVNYRTAAMIAGARLEGRSTANVVADILSSLPGGRGQVARALQGHQSWSKGMSITEAEAAVGGLASAVHAPHGFRGRILDWLTYPNVRRHFQGRLEEELLTQELPIVIKRLGLINETQTHPLWAKFSKIYPTIKSKLARFLQGLFRNKSGKLENGKPAPDPKVELAEIAADYQAGGINRAIARLEQRYGKNSLRAAKAKKILKWFLAASTLAYLKDNVDKYNEATASNPDEGTPPPIGDPGTPSDPLKLPEDYKQEWIQQQKEDFKLLHGRYPDESQDPKWFEDLESDLENLTPPRSRK